MVIPISERAFRKGEVFGTPAMMAPEQVRGEVHRIDGRTDIWAVGVMLYELITRRKPFSSTDPSELYDQILTHDPRPPRQIDGSIPRELESICLKCLAKRRTERYPTAHDFRDELNSWLSNATSTHWPQPANSKRRGCQQPTPRRWSKRYALPSRKESLRRRT